jgi:hypothetical protein
MDPSTISLIVALLPLFESVIVDGSKLLCSPKKNMTPQEQIAALENAVKLLPDMIKK